MTRELFYQMEILNRLNYDNRKSKEESSEKGLFFVDISYTVNTVYEGNKQGSKEGREYPCDEI